MQPPAKNKGCSVPDPQLVERLIPFAPSRTDKALAVRFGISYATWRKLLAGDPVRSTLIGRLEQRVAALETAHQRNEHYALAGAC